VPDLPLDHGGDERVIGHKVTIAREHIKEIRSWRKQRIHSLCEYCGPREITPEEQ
jgi:hypothetical protein